MNTAIVDILDGLLTIKYSPPSDVSPINFREGIATVSLPNKESHKNRKIANDSFAGKTFCDIPNSKLAVFEPRKSEKD